MAQMNPYLNFEGNTQEAFNFYKSVFGGEFSAVMRFKDMPGGETISAKEQNLLMHIALPISAGNVLMGTDTLESMGQKLTFGNNYHIALNTDSKQEADKCFNGLSAGGKIEMPIGDVSWGAYFGMVTDKFGVSWMVSFDPNSTVR